MPSMNLSIPHTLEKQEALKRIKSLIGEVKVKFADRVTGVKETWTENSGEFDLQVMGLSVSGSIQVLDHEVKIESKLPFAAMAFKGKIEEAIRTKAASLLA